MIALGFSLALLIGVTLGLLGGGGSILTVPVLVYALGVPVKQAVPMSLVVVGVTSLFGVANHRRNGNIRWDAAIAFGPAAIIGAFDKKKTLAEALSDEIENTAKGDINTSYAMKKRDETERMARSAR